MNYLVEVLRFVHLIGGMYWFGAAMVTYFIARGGK